MDCLANGVRCRIRFDNCFNVVDSPLSTACLSGFNFSVGVYACSNFRTRESLTKAAHLSYRWSIGGGGFNQHLIDAQVQLIWVPGGNLFTATGGGVIYSLPTS